MEVPSTVTISSVVTISLSGVPVSRAIREVIIFVVLAIERSSCSHLPKISSPVSATISAAAFADTYGAAEQNGAVMAATVDNARIKHKILPAFFNQTTCL
jgi:hypothetical protein